MLYKGHTAIAKAARLTRPAGLADETGAHAISDQRAVAAPEVEHVPAPDPRDLTIAKLESRLQDVDRQLATLRSEWQAELAKAAAKAKADAASEHVRSDAAELALLAKSLGDARQGFDAALGQNQADLTTQLAIEALSRLIEPNLQDGEWLARAIARRLAEMRANSVVALRIAPTQLPQAALARLREQLPVGAVIEIDPEIAPGQARIAMQLGSAQIDLAEGLARLVEELEVSNGPG